MVLEINGSKASIAFDLERLNVLRVHRIGSGGRTQGFQDVIVSEADHPFYGVWWPHGHILGWEHAHIHELHHMLDAIVNDNSIAPYGATFEDGYKCAVICDAILASSKSGSSVPIAY
jgi:predicted dehydrogenase